VLTRRRDAPDHSLDLALVSRAKRIVPLDLGDVGHPPPLYRNSVLALAPHAREATPLRARPSFAQRVALHCWHQRRQFLGVGVVGLPAGMVLALRAAPLNDRLVCSAVCLLRLS